MSLAERRESSRQQGSATAASSGVVIGRVQRITNQTLHVPHYHIEPSSIEQELDRFDNARRASIARVKKEMESLESVTDSSPALLLKAHLMLLEDENFIDAITIHIHDGLHNCGWSIQLGLSAMLERFDEVQDPYLLEMRDHIRHAGHRISSYLVRDEGSSAATEPHDRIIISDDIPLPEVVTHWRHGVRGLISLQGGINSHMIVMSRGIDMPALVGIEASALHHARDGETLILDAERKRWILNPSEKDLAHYRRFISAVSQANAALTSFAGQESVTLDRVAVELMCNVEFPQELDRVLQSGACGIGLLRSEFLFINSKQQPDASQQYQFYLPFVRTMENLPVTIRLLDIGADKKLPFHPLKNHQYGGENPALGMRGIRLLLRAPELLKAQIRAILRLSNEGNVKILVPMVTHSEQMERVRDVVNQEAKDLGLTADSVPLGAMIEVPAAVIIADQLAQVSDFFSIGSNDLIQYTMAADRCDDDVFERGLDLTTHPAIAHLIAMTATSATAAGIPVSICGELAADPDWTGRLLRMGITTLSMSSGKILPLHRHIRHLRIGAEE
ncbi:MAG: phosphoenolpyruvate--protein phosphotransferase [Mariprofundales bacterium]